MLSWAVRCVAIMAAVIGGFAYISGLDLSKLQSATTVEAKPAQGAVKPATTAATVHASEIKVRVGPDGHFVTSAYVNGVPIEFLIDTGATGVSLSAEDAERIGIRPSRNEFTVRFETANGAKYAAPVLLRDISIGGFSTGEMPAFISQKGALHVSLLGMSFLRRLESYEVQRGTLVLRW